MDSPAAGTQIESTHGKWSQPNNTVDHLQRAALHGRPVLIPGALEPIRQVQTRQLVTERARPFGPDPGPVIPKDGVQRERDRDAGGTPAEPVTLLDFANRGLLRVTDFVIWLLRTPPRSIGT